MQTRSGPRSCTSRFALASKWHKISRKYAALAHSCKEGIRLLRLRACNRLVKQSRPQTHTLKFNKAAIQHMICRGPSPYLGELGRILGFSAYAKIAQCSSAQCPAAFLDAPTTSAIDTGQPCHRSCLIAVLMLLL